MRDRRAHIGLILVATALLTSTILPTAGCATPAAVAGRSTANLTTPGIQALHAKSVIQVLDVVRDTAIAGEALTPKVIPTATAAKVVRWHKAAVQTLSALPAGAQTTLLTGIQALQDSLTAAEHAVLDPYLLSAKALIQAVIA